jgi:hypothetical protein
MQLKAILNFIQPHQGVVYGDVQQVTEIVHRTAQGAGGGRNGRCGVTTRAAGAANSGHRQFIPRLLNGNACLPLLSKEGT